MCPKATTPDSQSRLDMCRDASNEAHQPQITRRGYTHRMHLSLALHWGQPTAMKASLFLLLFSGEYPGTFRTLHKCDTSKSLEIDWVRVLLCLNWNHKCILNQILSTFAVRRAATVPSCASKGLATSLDPHPEVPLPGENLDIDQAKPLVIKHGKLGIP